ncbi:phosphatidylinositol kinase, partial [Hamiltosporidium magnivora]
DSNIKGVNDKDSNIKGVNDNTNLQQGVNNTNYKQHPFNTTHKPNLNLKTTTNHNTLPPNTYSLLKVFPDINTIFPLEAVIPNRKSNIKITGVKDSIYIYNSLQCPKRIELIGENGKIYSIMCKSKDDLRKDKRFMELNELLNTILVRDIRNSKRVYNLDNNINLDNIFNLDNIVNLDSNISKFNLGNIDSIDNIGNNIDVNNNINNNNNINTNTTYNSYIRTYNVVPIDSSNGILEIVGNLRSFRNICEEYLKERDVVLSVIMNKYRSRKKIGIEDFRGVCDEVGRVFYKFVQECTNNYDWYLRLKNFTISYAVMCVVGYFMGLGDRHGENILMDTVTAEAVHVDLSCIFDSGKMLEIREVVPFRLTQNIVSGFGCVGVEGLFRRTMEDVLKCLVCNKELIVSNLLGFVYDPLFEWSRRGGPNKGCNDVISGLFDKLKIKDVNERVNELIEEACDDVNLANMYIGWDIRLM